MYIKTSADPQNRGQLWDLETRRLMKAVIHAWSHIVGSRAKHSYLLSCVKCVTLKSDHTLLCSSESCWIQGPRDLGQFAFWFSYIFSQRVLFYFQGHVGEAHKYKWIGAQPTPPPNQAGRTGVRWGRFVKSTSSKQKSDLQSGSGYFPHQVPIQPKR